MLFFLKKKPNYSPKFKYKFKSHTNKLSLVSLNSCCWWHMQIIQKLSSLVNNFLPCVADNSVENPWRHRCKIMQSTYNSPSYPLIHFFLILRYSQIFSDVLGNPTNRSQNFHSTMFSDILRYSRISLDILGSELCLSTGEAGKSGLAGSAGTGGWLGWARLGRKISWYEENPFKKIYPAFGFSLPPILVHPSGGGAGLEKLAGWQPGR